MGGLVGGLFAGRVPDRIERLVLTSAPLPGLPDPPRFPGAWRVGLRVARPVADVLVGAGVRLKADAWRRWVDGRDTAGLDRRWHAAGRTCPGSRPSCCRSWRTRSGASCSRGASREPWTLPSSVVRALTVDEARTRAALDSIMAPTLLLWGADDRVIPQRLIDEVEAAHPSWSSRTIDGVGHLLPWESPEPYVELAG